MSRCTFELLESYSLRIVPRLKVIVPSPLNDQETTTDGAAPYSLLTLELLAANTFGNVHTSQKHLLSLP